MNKLWMKVFLMIIAFVMVGCTAISPHFYSETSSIEYEILGEVDYEGKTTTIFSPFSNGEASFKKLLEEAKSKYNADYVVNVTIDIKRKWVILFFITTYYMRGTAVKYK
jgi:uncharacterized protein YbjQ (UPF0145 family)